MKWTAAVVFLGSVLVWATCVSDTEGKVFAKSPGSVSALEDRRLTLEWQVSIPDADIESCYWENTLCSSCPVIQLVAFDNRNKKPVDTNNGAGWEFTDRDSPCRGGIQLGSVSEAAAGLYQLFVMTTNGTVHESDQAEVKLYKESALSVSINLLGINVTVPLTDSDIRLDEKQPPKDNLFPFALDFGDNLPADTKVTVTKYSGEMPQFVVDKCAGLKAACEIKLSLSSEKDVSLVVELDTGIQDYHIVKITQLFTYYQHDQGSVPAQSPDGAVAVALAVMLALLCAALLIYVILLCICWKGRKIPGCIKDVMLIRKREQNTNTDPEKQPMNVTYKQGGQHEGGENDEHFDCVLVYSKKDAQMAISLKDLLKKFIQLNDEKVPEICILDRRDNFPDIESEFKHMEEAIKKSNFMFMVITETFVSDTWSQMQKDAVLMQAIKERKQCVVPLDMQMERTDRPFFLRAYKGVDMRGLLPNAITWDTMRVDRTDREDLDSRPLEEITRILNTQSSHESA